MNHTPTPYTLHHEFNGTYIRDAGGGLVASLEAGNQVKRDADAAFIVRTCNSHDALVAALETAEGFRYSSPDTWYPAVQAALELAKGE